jgi:glutamate carboxypeptidase
MPMPQSPPLPSVPPLESSESSPSVPPSESVPPVLPLDSALSSPSSPSVPALESSPPSESVPPLESWPSLPASQATAAALLARLRGYEDEMADLLAELARLESPSLDAAAQGPVFDLLERELRAVGMRVRRLRGRSSGGHLYAAPAARATSARPGMPAVLAGSAGRAGVAGRAGLAARPATCAARRPGPRPAQLLLGHCDTVWPLGMLASMPVERRSGRLYGPGVYDMKGGLVQALYALRALGDLGLRPAATPLFFVNSDEEIGSRDSTRHIRRLARAVKRVFVLEPALGARGDLKTRRKGVGQFTVTVRGRASHAGLEPERGASAILELALVIQRLYALADPARGVTVNVGVIAGGMRGNVVAPEARAEVDVRVLRPEDAPALEAAVRGLAAATPGTRLEVEGAIDRPPLMPTAANIALWRTAEDAGHQLGLTLGHGTAGGASDGNTTSLSTATLDGLGAVGGGAHSLDEHVEIARMPERAALLALLLLAPLGAATEGLADAEPTPLAIGGVAMEGGKR